MEIVLVQGQCVVLRHIQNLYFYLFGSQDDNELILEEVLEGIVGALEKVFQNQIDNRMLHENFELLMFIVDEALDDGMIMETDASEIAQRVSLEGSISSDSDPLTQVLMNARNKVSN